MLRRRPRVPGTRGPTGPPATLLASGRGVPGNIDACTPGFPTVGPEGKESPP